MHILEFKEQVHSQKLKEEAPLLGKGEFEKSRLMPLYEL